MSDNGLREWPEEWPEYHNACTDACDMRIGPCACGAWHKESEWTWDEVSQTLTRYKGRQGLEHTVKR